MTGALRGLFVSHGAPTLPLEDAPARDFLRTLGTRLPRPRAIVAVSPHWMTSALALKSPPRFQTWHDFGGFPDELYRLRYEPPGDAALLARVREQLDADDIDAEIATTDRRLDHGIWVPLMLMYPQADIPLVQVSLTWDTPGRYREIGRTLRPLTDDGVLLLGTGGVVHNLRELDFAGPDVTPEWSREFDTWIAQRLAAGDWDALCDYRRRAPHAERAHPTEDHLLPLFFAGGAGDTAQVLHGSFTYGSLSMAVYGFGG